MHKLITTAILLNATAPCLSTPKAAIRLSLKFVPRIPVHLSPLSKLKYNIEKVYNKLQFVPFTRKKTGASFHTRTIHLVVFHFLLTNYHNWRFLLLIVKMRQMKDKKSVAKGKITIYKSITHQKKNFLCLFFFISHTKCCCCFFLFFWLFVVRFDKSFAVFLFPLHSLFFFFRKFFYFRLCGG